MKWKARTAKVKVDENDSVLEKIAKIRGVKDINRFLNPTEDELFDPYLIKNIEDASNRIIRAIKNGENILTSYDPDADGVTANTVMIRHLKNYTDKVDYIYGERNDGHGIYEMTKLKENYKVKEEAKENETAKDKTDEEIRKEERLSENIRKIEECDLLILIDSSSNDTKACKVIAEEMGKEIIVLDHHAIERENPYVLLVNPQQEGDEYPNKQLSGAGIVFKVLQVMEDTLGEVDPFQYMDLVAVGMYGDMMRVDVLENRFMIMYGLRNVKNVGLLRILKGAKADLYKLNSDSIGFSIAPMINGVARLNDIKLAIDILLTDEDNEAKKLRLKMHKLNEKRKEIQKEITERYCAIVDSSKKVLIVSDDKSSKGFNGLVCQQLSDKYKRPAIVGRMHNGVLSGSFRSYNGFNFKQFLNDSKLIEEALGHNQAGGIIVKEENLEDLINYIEDNLPNLEEAEQHIIYDLELDIKDVNDYINPMEQFNLICGNGFQKIIVKVNNVTVEESSIIGEKMETCKIKTFDNLELIKFRVNPNYGSDIGVFDNINVVGKLCMNEWFNFKTKQKISNPQIILDDYEVV